MKLERPKPMPKTATQAFGLADWEMLLMRLAFAVVVFMAIKWEVASLGKADPKKLTGLAHWVSLDFLRHLEPVWPWQVLTGLGLAAYVAGAVPVLGLLPALFFSLSIGTLANSQGAANHSTQLVSMILLGQWLTCGVLACRGGVRGWLRPDSSVQRRVVHVSMVVFVAAYVVSAWMKLDNSDLKWIQRVPSLALELQKSNWSEYYDTLTPVPDSLNTVVRLMTEHPQVARLVFGGGLVIELLAFVALFGRRWAFFAGLAVIVMHLSISQLMQLDFGYHMAAAMIFLVNLPGIGRTFGRTAAA